MGKEPRSTRTGIAGTKEGNHESNESHESGKAGTAESAKVADMDSPAAEGIAKTRNCEITKSDRRCSCFAALMFGKSFGSCRLYFVASYWFDGAYENRSVGLCAHVEGNMSAA
jgi:hypothetical protein